MRFEVLGCHGGELPGCKTTCFLIDGVLALDAGALTSSLDLEKLSRIDDIVVSHSHIDHVRDLPLLADLLIGRRDRPVTIHGSVECVQTLKANMFNDALWPDFTRLPDPGHPILRFRTFTAGEAFEIGPYRIQSIPVSHPVESCGFIVSDGQGAVALSGDTGPTDELWRVLNQTKNLKALLVEVSFPSAMQEIADVSGHLTPASLKTELAKFQRNGTEVFLYHLKPAFLGELKRELAEVPAVVLELGDAFEL